jgi:hypothetical protein
MSNTIRQDKENIKPTTVPLFAMLPTEISLNIYGFVYDRLFVIMVHCHNRLEILVDSPGYHEKSSDTIAFRQYFPQLNSFSYLIRGVP